MIFLKLTGCVEVMASKADTEMDQHTNRTAADEELNMSEDEQEDGLDQKEVEDDNQEKGNDVEEEAKEDEEEREDDGKIKKAKGKKCAPGIVYLGHIPPRIRPKHVRNMLAVYGEIGRIFLQSEG